MQSSRVEVTVRVSIFDDVAFYWCCFYVKLYKGKKMFCLNSSKCYCLIKVLFLSCNELWFIYSILQEKKKKERKRTPTPSSSSSSLSDTE